MIFSLNMIAQIKVNDSLWLAISPRVQDSFAVAHPNRDYRFLYTKPIQVSQIAALPDGMAIKPLVPTIQNLLQQFHLDDSYSELEIKETAFGKSVEEAAYLSYPFANIITSNLASALKVKHNVPQIIAYQNKIQQLQSINKSAIKTTEMIKMVLKDDQITIDKQRYLQKRLLDFLVGNYNQKPENQYWLIAENKVIPYLKSYDNQFMTFGGTHQLLKQILPAFKHFENYGNHIKNIKKVSEYSIGFDVNILSSLTYNDWNKSVSLMQKVLTTAYLSAIKKKLPKTIYQKQTDQLFENLKLRIERLAEISDEYYQLIHKNKIIYATNKEDKIEIIRKSNSSLIHIYDAVVESEKPLYTYEFLNKNTNQIWIYGLDESDYFTVSGQSNNTISIALIGGKGGDKYVLDNGKNIQIYDEKKQTYLVATNQASICLANGPKFTNTDIKKYKHTDNALKPLFGANPDDGIFVGISDTFLIQNFNRNPFSQKHQLNSQLNLGNLGFQMQYYGEIATLSNHFNVFGQLGYQSPNYATNFFGFGNETPNLDTNLKLDYNRVRMESMNVELGVVKNENKYEARANLFFNSYKIEATANRFLTSETLFFPEDDFFYRKNYTGLLLNYLYRDFSVSFLPGLTVKPKLEIAFQTNLSSIKNSLFQIHPNLKLAHPLYVDKITFETELDYNMISGTAIPFYLSANIGGNNGLRGFRNQRFTGTSSIFNTSNVKWKAKDVKSDVIPLQIGLFAGLDMGRVWLTDETSKQVHFATGGGVWLQSADLMKLQLQVFGFDEGTRISFNLSMGF